MSDFREMSAWSVLDTIFPCLKIVKKLIKAFLFTDVKKKKGTRKNRYLAWAACGNVKNNVRYRAVLALVKE